MPFFGFFGGNLLGLAKRGSRLEALARKIATPFVVRISSGRSFGIDLGLKPKYVRCSKGNIRVISVHSRRAKAQAIW